MIRRRLVLIALGAACGGPSASSPGATGGGATGGASAEDDMIAHARTAAADGESQFGPLDVGADFASYTRVTKRPFLSLVHGNRWVHVYVNQVGVEAYLQQGATIPVGTTIVKASWLDDGHGRPSSTPGPIYVMQKRAVGYAPEQADWYYAIHWAKPVGKFEAMGPFYWRGKSARAEFCYDCHDAYDRSLGGLVPSSLLPR